MCRSRWLSVDGIFTQGTRVHISFVTDLLLNLTIDDGAAFDAREHEYFSPAAMKACECSHRHTRKKQQHLSDSTNKSSQVEAEREERRPVG